MPERDREPPFISHGTLPPDEALPRLLSQVYERYRGNDDGDVSTVYPLLAQASRARFGLAVVDVRGACHEVGDSRVDFTLMSVAKPFVLALACNDLGIDAVIDHVGIDATGLAFNSLATVEQHSSGRSNPMVNSGAIVTASLVAGGSSAERWERIRATLSAFAGRQLTLDDEVYASASATNQRNRELAELVAARGAIAGNVDDALDLYTRQSCLRVTAADLAVMGATLSDGGTNPLTGQVVVEPEVARTVLVSMTVAGLYETSGRWLLEVGLPGKSGIGGGIITVSPGKGALGAYSPPLDAAGNSVRGVLASADLSRATGLDIFASAPI